MQAVRFIGPGRAGGSLSTALSAAGWDVVGVLARGDDLSAAAAGVDAVVIATPDDEVAAVARAVTPVPGAVVLHLSGSLGLDVLAPHGRRASLHPLATLPTPEVGARRLRCGITFAVAGEPVARRMAEALGGRVVEVDDDHRAAYHAAACIAANHVVALLGQVERVAATAGLDLEAFLGLTRAAVDDVARLGARGALTGPAARGDWATLGRHHDALAPEEQTAYNTMVGLAMRLAGPPAGLAPLPAGASGELEADPVEEVPEVRSPAALTSLALAGG